MTTAVCSDEVMYGMPVMPGEDDREVVPWPCKNYGTWKAFLSVRMRSEICNLKPRQPIEVEVQMAIRPSLAKHAQYS